MSFKNFMKDLGYAAAKYAKENGKSIAVNAIASALNVPVTTNIGSYYNKPVSAGSGNYIYPRNSAEAAIDSLYKSNDQYFFDSDKEKLAYKIYNLAKTSDESTKTYAIYILSKITDEMIFGSSKERVSKMIENLGMPTPPRQGEQK